MSRFGWAYVNSLITGTVANGPTNSIQFNSGSQILSGSSNFTFNPATNKVTLLGQLTGSTLVISASVVSASTYLGISAGGTPGGTNQTIQFNSGSAFSGSTNLTFDYTTNTLSLTGTLRADTLIVSSSQILKSGSTIFGDDTADTHQFTGSIFNTTLVSGTTAQFTTITGSAISGSALSVSGISIFEGQVRAFNGIQARNSNILVTNLAGTTTLATMTTAGLVSGSTAEFTIITGSTITGSTGLFTIITGSNISVSNELQVAGPSFLNGNANIGGNILGSGGFKANYNTFSASFTASSLSYFIGVSTTGSVVTASLNSATNYPAGQTLIFKDVGGNTATNNIRIQPSGSQTIDGATSLIISNTSGSATLVSNGVDGFYIVGLT